MALFISKEPSLDAKKAAFDYQVEASEAIRDLPYAAVFHEQGLGKTKIAIDVILYWLQHDIIDTVLLVTKKALIANWVRELGQHSYLSPRLLSTDRTANFHALNSPARVIIAGFESVEIEKKRLQLFQKTRRVAAILDESAKIKNPNTTLTKAFLEIAPGFTRRIIMTGTPVANRPHDLWSQVYFLDQGLSLGRAFSEFERDLALTNTLNENRQERDRFESALAGLWPKLAPFAVRETKAGGRVQLPAKEIENIPVAWEVHQRQMYLKVRDETRLWVVQDGISVQDESDDILKRLLRLVQIASNPGLVDQAYSYTPGKWEALATLLADIVAKGEKAIVWTSFTENADWLADRLRDYGATKVHGKLRIDDRNRHIDRFLAKPDCKVLVATPGAAKEGLTLTVANHVIFFDRSFSLDDYLQAQDRIHRVSQTKTCYVYNLVMEDSIDEWIDALLQAKRAAAQLAQGDISRETYQSRMTYTFGEILQRVLAVGGATKETT